MITKEYIIRQESIIIAADKAVGDMLSAIKLHEGYRGVDRLGALSVNAVCLRDKLIKLIKAIGVHTA